MKFTYLRVVGRIQEHIEGKEDNTIPHGRSILAVMSCITESF
jgi:hypothetical protein